MACFLMELVLARFVYLRRIIENLIENYHIILQNAPCWDEAKYQKAKVKDKIKMLEGYFPVFFRERPTLWGFK